MSLSKSRSSPRCPGRAGAVIGTIVSVGDAAMREASAAVFPERLEPFPHLIVRFARRAKAFDARLGDRDAAARFSTALLRRRTHPRLDEALLLEPAQRDVDGRR